MSASAFGAGEGGFQIVEHDVRNPAPFSPSDGDCEREGGADLLRSGGHSGWVEASGLCSG